MELFDYSDLWRIYLKELRIPNRIICECDDKIDRAKSGIEGILFAFDIGVEEVGQQWVVDLVEKYLPVSKPLCRPFRRLSM